MVAKRAPAQPSRGIQDAERYFLPRGYQSQDIARSLDEQSISGRYWTAERIEASRRYQRHVYAWAAALIRKAARGGSKPIGSVLDVGCGPGVKLHEMIAPLGVEIEGVDQPSAVREAESRVAGRYTAVNLENPGIAPSRTFDLIICADVIEHLLDPDGMLEFIRGMAHPQTFILFSTPERSRLRGRDCRRCEKPDHVREWARDEFLAFLRSRRFDVRASRLMPQDDSPPSKHFWKETRFRMRLGARSPLCCHAVLCRVAEMDGDSR